MAASVMVETGEAQAVARVPRDVVLQGDCLDVLRTLPDACVDAVVTDPPAGVSFMGKDWDHDKGGRCEWIAWLAAVMTECRRVLKPGGHALVWALPRTCHWTGTAIEDAGFEVRDCVYHLFGSGFPKSLDVGKAIDKAAGAQRTVLGTYKGATNVGRGSSNSYIVSDERAPQTTVEVTEPATDAPRQWQGWGTALKPAVEVWWLARKPLDGTVAQNVTRYGTGALNVDGCRVGGGPPPVRKQPVFNSSSGLVYGMKTGVGRNGTLSADMGGRWPPHLLLTHSLWCDEATGCVDGCPVALLDAQSGTLHSGAGNLKRASGAGYRPNALGAESRAADTPMIAYGDTGGASRYFPVFRYVAKASRRERNAGCETLPVARGPVMSARCRTCGRGQLDGRRMGPCCAAPDYEPTPAAGLVTNHHPTVKPLALMRWLVRLITPPGGLVLDPFAGSGSTLVACVQVGVHYLGIEREAEYVQIAQARVAAASRLPVEEMPDDLPAMTSPTPASEPAPVLAAATSRATTRPSRRRSSKIAPFPAPQPSLWGASALMREWRDLPCVDILL